VLFNRFYQPDLDIEALDVKRSLVLSTSDEMRLPLRWIAMLYGQVKASLALTTGIHTTEDVVKAVMAGAAIANVASVLLKEGIGTIATLMEGLHAWMEAHDYATLVQMQGALSLKHIPNPAAFERANYVKLIGQS
jgi:dihydroorotate dehydrogenase (fumarate)